jgi:uncharacterized protein YuzE
MSAKPIRISSHARFEMTCGDGIQNKQDHQILEDTLKVIYDKETDTLSIIFRDGKVAESDEPRPGLILDYDKSGRLVSIELLDASDQVMAPESVEFGHGGTVAEAQTMAQDKCQNDRRNLLAEGSRLDGTTRSDWAALTPLALVDEVRGPRGQLSGSLAQ